MIIVVLKPRDDVRTQIDLAFSEDWHGVLSFISITPGVTESDDTLNKAGGLFLTGDKCNSRSESCNWYSKDLEVVKKALELDMPVLATGYGIFLLNQTFGGQPPVPLTNKGLDNRAEDRGALSYSIYISPGSKSAATIGSGGFFKVTSRFTEGLFDLQRAPRLLASAYSVEDGVVEGLESPEHSWVFGFRANIERHTYFPRAFYSVFLAFFERAENFSKSRSVAGMQL